MKNYSVDISKKWDYENGFYLTCETSRIGKFLNHLEIYNHILGIEGDILEFGVYKGASLVRLLSIYWKMNQKEKYSGLIYLVNFPIH